MTKLLAISGSLRRKSINTKLLTAMMLAAPTGVTATLCNAIGSLPLFNPDLDGNEPGAVHRFWDELAMSDGVVIASPEYAHGYTGVIKNALDWTVGSGSFVGKPVAVLNAAPRSSIAHSTLIEVLRTIDAVVVPKASIDIPVLGKELDAKGLLRDAEAQPLISESLEQLLIAVRSSAGK